MTAGASAGYVFANALLYWLTKLQLATFAGTVLYVGYSALISFLFFILTGESTFFTLYRICADFYTRINWLLCKLAVCTKDLWIDQN